ncbi:MAG: hypothetical protein AAF236_12990 [Verrucomicrobiota bacterium]
MGFFSSVTSNISATKTKLLVVAGAALLGGLTWKATEIGQADEPPRTISETTEYSARERFADIDREGLSEAFADATKSKKFSNSGDWSGALIRLAFSFGIAMVLGTLVRHFFKTAITMIVVLAIGLWLLEFVGVIPPVWEEFGSTWAEVKPWVEEQTSTVRGFLSGYLPSSGAALLGFAFGLMR